MEFILLSGFRKELKKLLKKYRTMEEDLEVLKSFLVKFPEGFEPIVFRISNLGIDTKIFKVKKFRCKALRGSGSNSGIRVIYAYIEEEKRIEFIEIYHKGGKKDHNKDRILEIYE